MLEEYKNPPIQEAICEFRFKSENWDPTISGTIYPKIKKRFPKKESVQEGEIKFTLDRKTKQTPEVSHSRNEYPKFSNDAGNIFTIIGKNKISIHLTKPYSNWKDFSKNIMFIYDKYKDIAKPEKLERVGLRYINKLFVPKKDFIFSDYFKINRSPFGDTMQTEDITSMHIGIISKDDKNLIRTQFIELENHDNKKEFILDIDYFSDNLENAKTWLESAHDKIKIIFLGSLEEKIKNTFK